MKNTPNVLDCIKELQSEENLLALLTYYKREYDLTEDQLCTFIQYLNSIFNLKDFGSNEEVSKYLRKNSVFCSDYIKDAKNYLEPENYTNFISDINKNDQTRIASSNITNSVNYINNEILQFGTYRNSKNNIYSKNLIFDIKLYALLEWRTYEEIYQYALARQPKVTLGNLGNIISRKHIPYKGNRKKISDIDLKEVINEQINKYQNKEKVIDDNKEKEDKVVSEIINDKNLEVNKNETDIRSIEDIEKEVNTTLDRKYQKMHCNFSFNYTLDDLIKCITMIQDIKINGGAYFNDGSSKYDILNGYQEDIIHEIENIDDINNVEYNDYLLKKLNIFRNIRRVVKNNGRYLKIIEPCFKNLNIDNKILEDTLKELKKEKEKLENPSYIPSVDSTMTDKYDWAISPVPTSRKCIGNPVVRNEVDKKLKSYKVTCLVSGAGRVFSNWSYTYNDYNEEGALNQARNFWEIEKKKKGGNLLITNLKAYELNI